jgi:catechol 2,3-dioxygenase-like lactoylglutathione lyase family enzyme
MKRKEDEMMTKMFGALNHIAIYVRNRQEAIDFYTDLLGGKLLFTVDNESDGLLIAMIQMEGYCIELLEPPQGKDKVMDNAMATANHFAITVDDIDQTIAFIEEKGFAIEKPGIYNVPNFGRVGNNMQVAFFHGPNGERIELFKQL